MKGGKQTRIVIRWEKGTKVEGDGGAGKKVRISGSKRKPQGGKGGRNVKKRLRKGASTEKKKKKKAAALGGKKTLHATKLKLRPSRLRRRPQAKVGEEKRG